MPVEAVSCPKCGSPDATEFKSGSYVCGHCEAIFKHVVPGAASGGCEVDGCGVPAIGQCSSCGRRFCATHQANDSQDWSGDHVFAALFAGSGPRTVYVDRCAPCYDRELGVRTQAQEAQFAAERETYRRWLQSIDDPIERMLAALESLYRPGSSAIRFKGDEDSTEICEGSHTVLLRELCPELLEEGNPWRGDNYDRPFPTPLGWSPKPPPWIVRGFSPQIAQWFASRATKAGLQQDTVTRVDVHVSRFGRGKEVLVAAPAWVLRDPDSKFGAYVFPGGRIGYGRDDRVEARDELSAYQLRCMAKLLDLGFRPGFQE